MRLPCPFRHPRALGPSRRRGLLAAFLFALLALPAAPAAGVLGDDLNEEESSDYVSLPKLRLAGDYGFSQWLMPNDSDLTSKGQAYYDDLERGWATSGDLVYYFLPRGGIGLTWIRFQSEAKAEDLAIFDDGLRYDLVQKTLFDYLGPSFWTRIRAGRFGLVHVGFGAGWFRVLDKWTENGVPKKVEASTYALVTSLGYDYPLWRFVGLGMNGRFFFSNLAEYTLNGETRKIEDVEDQYSYYNIPMYRLELSLGLRFYLF